ncbi:hypothetical protein QUF31_10560 [Dickeya chrysanthemi]|uniref:hypothetical protein n=1 Tax=Dickeya chrysanthemi TaxID=556 RepID=UPI0025A0508D|nr:hypothetical protein [Dickeya chrysanthemi]WJM83640.1 hypothetical protein QUF31_10560 [Dickeya chrysanthemi]
MTFRLVAITTSFLFLALAVAWMFFPEQMLAQWGVQYSDGAGVVGRCGAAFYTGIAVTLLMARNTTHSATRMALIQGMITLFTTLIVLGVYEFAIGHASYQILTAAVIESVLGLAFLYVRNTSGKVNDLNNLRINK